MQDHAPHIGNRKQQHALTRQLSFFAFITLAAHHIPPATAVTWHFQSNQRRTEHSFVLLGPCDAQGAWLYRLPPHLPLAAAASTSAASLEMMAVLSTTTSCSSIFMTGTFL